MKIDWHAGIILLFALSSLFFLGKALANKRSGKAKQSDYHIKFSMQF